MKNLKSIVILMILPFLFIPVFADSNNETSEFFEKGLDAVIENSFSDALYYFDKVLEQDSENIDALNNKAAMLIQLERLDESNELLDKSLSLDPNNIGALNNKGLILHIQENPEESEIYFDQVLEIDPNNIYALTLKSQLLINSEETFEADKLLTKALSLNPNHILALSLKSSILIKNGEISEGLEYLKQIYKIKPSLEKTFSKSITNEFTFYDVMGSAEIQINDSHGNLVGVLHAKKIRLLDHEITHVMIDKWEYGGDVLIEEIKYEIRQSTKVFPIYADYIAGRTGVGIAVRDSETTEIIFENQFWIVMAIHPQYLLAEGDVLTIHYTILRPVV